MTQHVAVRIVRLPCCDSVQSIGCSQSVLKCLDCKQWTSDDQCEGVAVVDIPYDIDAEGDVRIDDGHDAYSGA